jgi:hypothetical protein
MPNCRNCLHKGPDHNWRVSGCSLCVGERTCSLCGGGPAVQCQECQHRKEQRRFRGACLIRGCLCGRYVPRTDKPKPVNGYAGRAVSKRPALSDYSFHFSRMNPTDKIRALNDALRNLTGEGRIYVTAGIAALSDKLQAEIMTRVFNYSAFTRENDPYHEHDFGSFEHADKAILWKIDCYDRELKYGSPDPADEAVTTRVLTVMLAEEY